MNLATPQPHSIWLCPEEAVANKLADSIAWLTKHTGTARFEPHVTLIGDLDGMPDKTFLACQDHLVGRESVSATVQGVAKTDRFFMSLFLELDVPTEALIWRKKLCATLGIAHAGPFQPHISLAYGLGQDQLSPHELAEIENEFVGSKIRLHTAVIVKSAQSIPIEEWRRLHVLNLAF